MLGEIMEENTLNPVGHAQGHLVVDNVDGLVDLEATQRCRIKKNEMSV